MTTAEPELKESTPESPESPDEPERDGVLAPKIPPPPPERADWTKLEGPPPDRRAEFARYVSGNERRTPKGEPPEVSIIVPVYHNAGSLDLLYDRIQKTMDGLGVKSWDITFGDDNSKDHSRAILHEMLTSHDNVRVLHMSKNFGSFEVIAAGLEFARGRCVAAISADLQDPPEILDKMVRAWRKGTKVVVAARESRDDPFVTRALSASFYVVFRALVSKEMPPNGFDCFVIDHQVAELLLRYAEKNTSMPAALLWLGFEREVFTYKRGSRVYGRSMWTFSKKFKLMYDAILSYTYVPLRAMAALGLFGVVVSFFYAIVVIVTRLRSTEEMPGWASLMVVTLFFNGAMLMSIGVVGEYVWRAFDAARKRPNYIVDRWAESSDFEADRKE